MALDLHWFLPTAGDSRDVVGFGPTVSRRDPDLDYLTQVAKVAEKVGFDAVLTPTGTFCEDAWLTTAALIAATERLRFLVAFRPGLISPTLAAQQAATFQRLSAGRLLLNIVTGGSAVEQRRFGDHLDHDQRYDRCDEFLTVLKGAWTGKPFTFTGDHFQVEDALVARAPDPQPAIFFGGSSDAGKRVAARHADVWLMWGEPPESAAAELASVKAQAAALGRDVKFGIRLHTITRDTSEAAWTEADRLLAAMPPEVVARSQELVAGTSDSIGQARMTALHGGDRDKLVISPNLWAGFGLVRGGAGTALVGSHEEVAERLAEYHEIGFDHVILSGQPHVEEAYWFGEGVIPKLRAAGIAAEPGQPIPIAGPAPESEPRTLEPAR
ncbi:LLM class flavin-dependent oxidoreductase [Aquihabitans sp. G128]|uniref:LLM class flavin-dependent oxidoreductase n=1 Tax=Aquihabitans sp. G128 TaxID=2849779 RepID=UPI001C217963|nr:LLM class flavin-dependent oxidoreductase [Aquihabitans sp. G128]QXC59385.1 LLM class flavin-dependent oxidoreductase [Aquihabitans sp. G128]